MDPTKCRRTPLKDVQIPAQTDHYLLDPHSSPPAYPFVRQTPEWHPYYVLDSLPPLAQVEPGVVSSSSTLANYHWNDSLAAQHDDHLDSVSLHSLKPYRSFTPPISPPMLSPPATDAEYSSKRSGMTFALVPAEVDGMHVYTHVVANHRGNDRMANFGPPSISSGDDGLPEDMQDVLRQLDDLASWVKAASSSRDCISNLRSIVHATRLTGHSGIDAGRDTKSNKGKNRLLSPTLPNNERGTRRDLAESSRGAMPGIQTNRLPGPDSQSEGFIYIPNCDTPEFLVGSSNSPIAYPVCGYSSHPLRYSPRHPASTHDILHHRRFLERRSAPCPPPTSSLISPSLGKTSFKTLFQRSRCNTTAMSHPSIPSGHVPVENVFRQGKRLRLPWLRI